MLTQRNTLVLTVVLVLLLASFSAKAREKSEEEGLEKKGSPAGEVSIEVTRAAVGVGVTWGSGTLKFRGKAYKFKVSGLNLIGLGITSTTARGEVYNLSDLSDFPGKYFGVEAGATLIKGSSGLVLKNTKGVVLNLKSKKEGVDLRIGDEGLSISPAWK